MKTVEIYELGNRVINKSAQKTAESDGQAAGKKSLKQVEIDGLKRVVEALRGKSNLSPAEQSQLDTLTAKLLGLETLQLTTQAMQTPLSPEALGITATGPGGKTS